ncbi:uncharacterized protein PRCAT00002889001 [Priceomyces carsonii]|uniref:uncharacterized protein n=1 Tax=Priceomyces carsonii TaxID=28549 RepID=UPI002ED83063|nr:unnamed protein product [Priceomyces carsonii]
MVKYSEDKLYELKDTAYVPQPVVLEGFNRMIEQVKLHSAQEFEKRKNMKPTNGDTYIDEFGNERPYFHMNRRRLSRGSAKPGLRKKVGDSVKVDEDGWATLTKPKKSFGSEDAQEERIKFRDSLKETIPSSGMKAKPNNKNLGSSKAVDSRDAIADKQTTTFNAFEALGDEEDDDE